MLWTVLRIRYILVYPDPHQNDADLQHQRIYIVGTVPLQELDKAFTVIIYKRNEGKREDLIWLKTSLACLIYPAQNCT